MVIPWPFGQKTALLNWSGVIGFLAMIYYIRLSPILTIGFGVILCLFLYLNYFILGQFNFQDSSFLYFSIAVFVIAWIGQFIGHKIEGKKPSFLQDLQFLLIGPAWLLHFICKKLNIKY